MAIKLAMFSSRIWTILSRRWFSDASGLAFDFFDRRELCSQAVRFVLYVEHTLCCFSELYFQAIPFSLQVEIFLYYSFDGCFVDMPFLSQVEHTLYCLSHVRSPGVPFTLHVEHSLFCFSDVCVESPYPAVFAKEFFRESFLLHGSLRDFVLQSPDLKHLSQMIL